MERIINIAFLAHVDAGKTTITEQLLFQSGALKSAGNVDKGTAVTDFMQVEKDRGISVVSSHVSLNYRGVQINIIDTPGHADFMSEVERSLLAVDAVVLLISAADGVQAQTRVLWGILEKLKIPRIILINKVDRKGVALDSVLDEIKKELSQQVISIQNIENEGSDQVIITSNRNYNQQAYFNNTEGVTECLAEYDDEILESYLQNEEPKPDHLISVYHQKFLAAEVFPVLYSVAKVGLGVKDLLDELIADLSKSQHNLNSELSAIVFKITHHPTLGKLAHLRIFSGIIVKRQPIFNQRLNTEEKVNQIKAVFSNQYKDIVQAGPGDIVAISGFSNAIVGDVVGKLSNNKSMHFNTVPILTVQLKPVKEQDYLRVSEALAQLYLEDPLLQFQWFKDEKEFHIKINGWIQIEILQQLLKERFQLDVEFLPPSVIYKETPATIAIGYDEYTMPKPCWAVVKFKIEPRKRGSGVHFQSNVGVNDILLKYQKEVERTISTALKQGIKGWEVTDIDITLIGGEDHVVHSRAGDFVIATPMAIMDALKNANTHLLEPIMKFTISAPEDILGQITSDLIKMRGVFKQPEILNGKLVLKGKVPVATSLEYPVKLSSRSGGRASIQMQFDSYEKVDNDLGMIRDFIGISPLDRAKYILKARKAIR